jgi:RND family efflux transporter MFP subunit
LTTPSDPNPPASTSAGASAPPHVVPQAGENHEEGQFDPRPHVPSTRRVAVFGFLAVLAFGGLAGAGILPRLRSAAASASAGESSAKGGDKLAVAKVKRAAAGGEVALPGTVKALQEAAIYARTNGYLEKYRVDIGDTVAEGDVLAEIDAPELDQELAQARAAAAQASAVRLQESAKLELARSTLERTKTLAAEGLASKQDLEEKSSAVRAQEASVSATDASVGAAAANVRRLSELKRFQKVVAPFAGTITSRSAEPGALIVSGAGGQPLFRVAQTDPVRVFVQVPQLYAASIKVGAAVKLTVRELRGRVFTGKITRTTKSLDPSTHTLTTEAQFPNGDGALMPGTYVRVALGALGGSGAEAPLVVPSTALVVNAKGTQLAVVEQGVVHLRPVEVDGDYGEQVSIAAGVREGELVVVMPTDRLAEGQHVEVAEAKP